MSASLWAPDVVSQVAWQEVVPRPWESRAEAAPAAEGSENSILTAFTGDMSKCVIPVKHYITGANSLGTPSTGYKYTKELYPHYTYLYNSSGWNNSDTSNVGRTAAAAYRTKVDHYGQGDGVAYNASVNVFSRKSSATKFLAQPAGVILNGDAQAFANNVYLNMLEVQAIDNGYDASAIGLVTNLSRTNATGSQSNVWLGYRAQSQGSQSCDSVLTATGKWKFGIDFTMASLDLGANGAAISLKANQWIYGNNNANASGNTDADWYTTGVNGDKIGYDSSISGWNIVVGGTSRLQINSSQITSTRNFAVNTGGQTAIMRGLQTGFALPTGTTDTSTFDTASVTVARLAQYVKGLVERLHNSTSGAHAFIGA